MILDIVKLRKYIEDCGIKQKYIAEKANMAESKLSAILNKKRKCEVGEYANICKALGVEFEKFIKEKS
ncbi:MAG TPA: helix-turn-helix domain-containing protein [Candidatus Blautia excrementipullorum]|nr:helix-turn-helix domain-containing protein [Candidatus Blautia excrementipullorum]